MSHFIFHCDSSYIKLFTTRSVDYLSQPCGLVDHEDMGSELLILVVFEKDTYSYTHSDNYAY